MTAVFLTNASVSPWSKPGDWQDAGHTVNLVGAGGRGGTTTTGTTYRSGSGGGGGGHVLNTYSSGALSSTTPFFINVNYAGSVGNDAATAWGSGTISITNSYYVQGGTQGVAGGAAGLGGVTTTTLNGTPPTPVYTQTQKQNGGNGGATGAVTGSAGGGGGAGGPSGVGGAGGPCATASRGGGGGGGSNGGATGGGTSASANGAAGGGGAAGGSSGVAAVAGTTNTGGGGGGGFFTAVVANVSGAAGGDEDLWTETVGGATDGPGGGGGGAGACSVNTAGATCNGGNGANYGAGGGGAGGTRSGTSTRTQGAGASGLIVITYTAFVSVAHQGAATFVGAGSLSALVKTYKFAEARFGAHPTSFDPGFLHANARLTSDNLTVTALGSPSSSTSTRSKESRNSGKFFCEFTFDAGTAAAFPGVGFCNGSHATSSSLANTLNSIGYHTIGNVYLNGANVGFLESYDAGDIIGMAVDFNAKLVWFRKNDGDWNANGSADPVTGAGGISFSSLNPGPYFVAVECRTNADQFTVDFIGSIWTPADLPGLVLWLKADEGVTTVSGKVSLWEDQSGRGNHVSQVTAGNRPVYDATGFEGRPSVTFDAANLTYLVSDPNVDMGGTDEASFFAVINRPSSTTGDVLSFLGSGQTQDSTNVNGVRPLEMFTTNLAYAFNNNSLVLQTVSLNTNIRVGDVIKYAASGIFTGYVDGDAGAPISGNSQMTLADNGIITIGAAQNSGPQNYFTGNISEIVVTKSRMTEQQIALLDDYFVRRWTFYKGPGDLVSGAVGWWGLRAYSAATIGANAVRLREDGGNTEQDFATIIGGGLDLDAIATFKGANDLFVVKLYDQVGTNHLQQATSANQPTFTLNGLGSLPIMSFTGSPQLGLDSASAITQAQPITVSAVLFHADDINFEYFLVRSIDAQFQVSWGGNDSIGMQAGAGHGGAATDLTWHALQAVYNGTSSDAYIDGASNPGNAGTLGFAGEQLRCPYSADGSFTEVGLWPSAFSASNKAAINANQRDYWHLYVGPGNIVPSATAWWGLRAYSDAVIGTNAIRLREDGANAERDFATVSGGGLDLEAIAAFKGLGNLFVVTWYDQTGNGNNLTQATSASQPPFILERIGTRPAIANNLYTDLAKASFSLSQPFTVSTLFRNRGVVAGFIPFFSSSGDPTWIGILDPGKLTMLTDNGGSVLSVTIGDEVNSKLFAWQAVFNAGSSASYINGTDTTGGSLLSSGMSGLLEFPTSWANNDTDLGEGGVWPIAFDATQRAAMDENQRLYYMFDVQGWVEQVVANGGSVSDSRKALVNNLIVGLKSDGIWQKLDRLWLHAGENSQSALTDLVAHELAVAVNSPTFTVDRGYTGDGSSSYISTTCVPSGGSKFQLNSGHLSSYSRSVTVSTYQTLVGAAGGGASTMYFTTIELYAGINFYPVGSPTSIATAGMTVISRYGASLVTALFNGSVVTNPDVEAPGLTNQPFYILARNESGGPVAGTYAQAQVAATTIGGGLTPSEAASLSSRINAYMTAIGAQVY